MFLLSMWYTESPALIL
ncbi:hypothetical protein F383_36264 [Gossypium arboreum]|uniref:Uncharacterized protein n=2 Tax=Gossypium arboreum TaxID=29729 RepID=A0A0B0NMZ3_GOSAR|nr:hypothetical protein F383_23391 [Gossypium arboreum]KHG29861.1 hypothetical protein F383_36264 [Gossypium arboreum]